MMPWPDYALRLSVLVALLLSHPGAATAADLSLLDHRLGEQLSAVTVTLGYVCEAEANTPANVRCRAHDPAAYAIAGIKLEALLLHYSAGRLSAVDIRFPESGFTDVAGLLHDAFGASRAEPEKLRGGMGGYFENAIYSWDAGNSRLRLEQFVGNINTSSIILAEKDLIDALIAPKRIDPASGLKDL